MDHGTKNDLKNSLIAVIEDYATEGTFEGTVTCQATINVEFTIDVRADADAGVLTLKDASGDSVRLVIEEGDFNEEKVKDAIEEKANLRLEDLTEDDILERAELTGYTEVTDIEIYDVDDIHEVAA